MEAMHNMVQAYLKIDSGSNFNSTTGLLSSGSAVLLFDSQDMFNSSNEFQISMAGKWTHSEQNNLPFFTLANKNDSTAGYWCLTHSVGRNSSQFGYGRYDNGNANTATIIKDDRSDLVDVDRHFSVKFKQESDGVQVQGYNVSEDGSLSALGSGSFVSGTGNPKLNKITITASANFKPNLYSIQILSGLGDFAGHYIAKEARTFAGTKIQLRHDTADNWTSFDPVLAVGEVGVETDTNRFKFGDGTTVWTNLPYVTSTTKTSELTNDSGFVTADSNPILDVPVNNCVLAMPTAPTFDGTNVTVYTGTKVAIANGLNADGTCKSNIVTLTADATINQSTYNGDITLMLKSDGTIDQTAYSYFEVDDISTITTLTAYCWYYDRKTNNHYLASRTGAKQGPYQRIKIGSYNQATGATTKYLKTYRPIALESDNKGVVSREEFDALVARVAALEAPINGGGVTPTPASSVLVYNEASPTKLTLKAGTYKSTVFNPETGEKTVQDYVLTTDTDIEMYDKPSTFFNMENKTTADKIYNSNQKPPNISAIAYPPGISAIAKPPIGECRIGIDGVDNFSYASLYDYYNATTQYGFDSSKGMGACIVTPSNENKNTTFNVAVTASYAIPEGMLFAFDTSLYGRSPYFRCREEYYKPTCTITLRDRDTDEVLYTRNQEVQYDSGNRSIFYYGYWSYTNLPPLSNVAGKNVVLDVTYSNCIREAYDTSSQFLICQRTDGVLYDPSTPDPVTVDIMSFGDDRPRIRVTSYREEEAEHFPNGLCGTINFDSEMNIKSVT